MSNWTTYQIQMVSGDEEELHEMKKYVEDIISSKTYAEWGEICPFIDENYNINFFYKWLPEQEIVEFSKKFPSIKMKVCSELLEFNASGYYTIQNGCEIEGERAEGNWNDYPITERHDYDDPNFFGEVD